MTHTQSHTNLEPSLPSLIDLQSDVREHFGWDEIDDIESAKAMILRVENSSLEIWSDTTECLRFRDCSGGLRQERKG